MPKLDSELLVRFVPMAFTWMVLRKLGVSSFPSSFIVFDQRERPVELPIAREHYFASALVIADDVVNHGFSNRITRATFEAIIARSAEMDSANMALADDILQGLRACLTYDGALCDVFNLGESQTTTLNDLIVFAYDLHAKQIASGPDWAGGIVSIGRARRGAGPAVDLHYVSPHR